MTTARLARRLGVDGNPLRRRSDKIAVSLAALLVAVFLAGAPWLSVAAVGWAGRTGATAPRAHRSARQASAVHARAAPVHAAVTRGVFGSGVLAPWAAPHRRAPAAAIPASAAPAASNTVPLWMDAAGSPATAPRSGATVLAREAIAVVVATAALGIVLWCLALAGRWILDRRRLANWEAAWAAVGPQWTKRFRSRG
jgi:hypothetical protein